MTTRLVFQGPGAELSLLGMLLTKLEDAVRGGGIFAWTNRAGVAAFVGSPAFADFIKAGNFELIVGTDSITDEGALDALLHWESELAGLDVVAFVHDQVPLFHPKLAWLETESEVRLLVGSGNLTRGGLQANWEAYTDTTLMGAAASDALASITAWRQQNEPYLLPLDDERVRIAVQANKGNERSLRQRRDPRREAPAEEASESVAAGETILVAEIPKNRRDTAGRSMFSQANFSRAIFEDYFGVQDGVNQVLLYHVNADGSLGDLESRQGKYKPKSKNYYFELGAASGVPHSGDSPPIGIFLQLDSGAHLYLYRLPNENGYDELAALLTEKWVPKGNQGRRVITSREEVSRFWPESPILQAAEPSL